MKMRDVANPEVEIKALLTFSFKTIFNACA